MSQTKAQLINAVDGSIVDADIVGLTSSKLSGALPAVSAANLTNIPAANLTGTLPAISGANLTGISAGITEADCWRMTANLQGVSTPATITTNLTRGSDITYIGSGMSESSGVFTFPVTGKWLIYVQVTAYGQYAFGDARIYTQVDGPSGYDTRAHAVCNVAANGGYGGGSSIALVDVTTTSYGARFLQYTVSTSGRFIAGDANHNLTAFTFIRLGDT